MMARMAIVFVVALWLGVAPVQADSPIQVRKSQSDAGQGLLGVNITIGGLEARPIVVTDNSNLRKLEQEVETQGCEVKQLREHQTNSGDALVLMIQCKDKKFFRTGRYDRQRDTNNVAAKAVGVIRILQNTTCRSAALPASSAPLKFDNILILGSVDRTEFKTKSGDANAVKGCMKDILAEDKNAKAWNNRANAELAYCRATTIKDEIAKCPTGNRKPSKSPPNGIVAIGLGPSWQLAHSSECDKKECAKARRFDIFIQLSQKTNDQKLSSCAKLGQGSNPQRALACLEELEQKQPVLNRSFGTSALRKNPKVQDSWRPCWRPEENKNNTDSSTSDIPLLGIALRELGLENPLCKRERKRNE